MTTYAIHDATLDLESVDRHRPSAGPAFEKHRWRVGGRPLLVGTSDLALRPNFDIGAIPITPPSRVTLWGEGTDAIVKCLLRTTGGFQVSSPHRRFGPEDVEAALASLVAEPDYAILAHPRATTPILGLGLDRSHRRATWEHGWRRDLWELLDRAASEDLELFTQGVAGGRFLVCAVRSKAWVISGFALYGSGELYGSVCDAATALDVSLTWTSPGAVRVVVDLGLPRCSEVPTSGSTDVDLSGYNVGDLPAHSFAERVDLSDTAIVDLEPLRTWANLREARLINLRPLSLGGLSHLAVLDVDASAISSQSLDVPATRDLTIRRVAWPNLQRMKTWMGLTRLAIHGRELGSLEGLDQLSRLRSLELHVDRLPADFGVLGSLSELEVLRLCFAGELDLRRLPPMPQLRSLALIDATGRGVTLEHPEMLSRLRALESLALTGTNVDSLAFVADLPELTHLDLDATDVSSIAEIAKHPRLQSLSLRHTYVADIEPLCSLNGLATLRFSSLSDITPRFDLLGDLCGLECLELHHDQLPSLAWVVQMPVLTGLSIRSARLSDIRPVANAARLCALALECSALTDIAAIGALGLESLTLACTRVATFEVLRHLHGLRKLCFVGGPIDLGPLAAIPLNDMDIDSPRLDNIEVIASMPLESLNLARCVVADWYVLQTLNRLVELDVSRSNIESLAAVQNLCRLRKLAAWGLTRPISVEPLLAMQPLARLELDARSVGVDLRKLTMLHNLVLHGE